MNETEFLAKAVEIYSPSYHESAVASFLVNEMANLGFKARVDEAGNAVGIRGKGGKNILLLGHIDTVPGEIKARVDEGRLFGRGSVDAKGPFCSFVMAAAKAESRCRIICVGAVEEEVASSKGARHIIGKYKPDYIIIGEPSGYDSITLGYKGRLLLDYALQREISHTASKNLGVIEDAVNFYYKMREQALSVKGSTFENIQISLRDINSASDSFRETISMKVAWRLPTGFDAKIIKALAEREKGDAKIKFYGEEKAIKADKNNALVRSFLKSIREHGTEPKFKYKTGTSDMNVMAQAFPHVPILAYGPGDSSLDHTPGEHIIIKEYQEAIKILITAIDYLAGH